MQFKFIHQSVEEKTIAIFLSISLHILVLIILSHQIRFLYQYPSSNSEFLTVELIQDFANLNKLNSQMNENINHHSSVAENQQVIEPPIHSDDSVKLNSAPTSGWRSNQKAKELELNPFNSKNNMQARIGIEQSQRYGNFQATVNSLRTHLANEKIPIRCSIKVDEEIKTGTIICNPQYFSELIKSYLAPSGITWTEELQSKKIICTPVAIQATGNELCN
jgi:hypothetical protein